uniref:CAZy families GH2 protein n=1 Tax=uncultured Dictyoglomus sp. TaxID=221213 RepID=A0A060C881_9BACT|nr:CAZy families GH2 protein [uncultured Dictyoglomus sp.]
MIKLQDLTDEFVAPLDVVGYNYMHYRWETDINQYPNRLICGTESLPPDVADIWSLVCKYPSILGDFVWTSMDYIGEVGIGKIDYDNIKSASPFGTWPWILAYCGDIDLIGIAVAVILQRSGLGT